MKASTKTLSRPQMLLAATALDWAIGDPEYLPHPVRLLGTAIARGERTFNRAGASRNQSFIAGALLTSALVTVTYLATRKLLHLAYRMHPVIGSLTEVTLASTCLASRNLHDEAAAVVRSLEAHDLPTARGRLARIVGRDTAELGVEGIARGVIETLAESACDGVVAPLFYLAAGGVPLAMAFKAISTLDSMIGHTTPRYLYFGKAAAGLDDVANYVPARLTAVAIAASAALSTRASAVQALRLWQRDGDRHASPNAGQPEAAMAGALGVQLGGASTYQGEPHHAPILGRQFPPPAARHARTALHLVAVTGFIATLAACALLKSCSRSRRA